MNDSNPQFSLFTLLESTYYLLITLQGAIPLLLADEILVQPWDVVVPFALAGAVAFFARMAGKQAALTHRADAMALQRSEIVSLLDEKGHLAAENSRLREELAAFRAPIPPSF